MRVYMDSVRGAPFYVKEVIIIRTLCLTLVLLLCLSSLAVAETPDRIGAVGVIERISEAGDNFWLRLPSGLGYLVCEVRVTDETILNMDAPLQEGAIVDVLFDAPVKTPIVETSSIGAARIQDAMYDMYINVGEQAGANPAEAYGTICGGARVLFPEGTDTEALRNQTVRFRPYSVEGSEPSELVEAREYEMIEIIDGEIIEMDGDTLLITPYLTEEPVRVQLTDHTTLVHALGEGMTISVVYTDMDEAATPAEVTALTIWPNFG